MERINYEKKIQKLNKYMKMSDREVYFWMFNSRALQFDYLYDDIKNDIKLLITNLFREDCDIHYLGSRVMGIGDEKESDLDFFIDIGRQSYFWDRNYKEDLRKLEEIIEAMTQRPHKWKLKKKNFSVPSVKVIHIGTGIKCDISVTNGMAVHNSHLIGHLFDIQPEAAAFYHYIKHWLRLFDIKYKGFTLTMLVVFFLQHLNFMPPISIVQYQVRVEKIDGCEVQFDAERGRDDYGIDEMKYYKDYVKSFFQFYSKFDFQSNVICPYSGKVIDKDYYQRKIDSNHPVTIAAPLMRHTNCAKYLTNVDVSNFLSACYFSCKYLEEYKPPKSICNDYNFFDKR